MLNNTFIKCSVSNSYGADYHVSIQGLLGRPDADATLSEPGFDNPKDKGLRQFCIMPDCVSDRGMACFDVNSVEEAEFILKQFIIAYNEEYKIKIWAAAKKSINEF